MRVSPGQHLLLKADEGGTPVRGTRGPGVPPVRGTGAFSCRKRTSGKKCSLVLKLLARGSKQGRRLGGSLKVYSLNEFPMASVLTVMS